MIASSTRCVCRIGIVVVSAILLIASGCGRSSAPWPQADLDKVKTGVTTALESWKKGERADKLASGSPPISISEPDWKAGSKLVDFEVLKAEGVQGQNARCWVKMSVQARGKTVSSERVYEVNLGDKITIGRDPFN